MYTPYYPIKKRMFSLASPPSITPTLGDEAINDPSIEAGINGWGDNATNCTPVQSADQAHSGTYSAKTVAAAAESVQFWQAAANAAVVSLSTRYIASYWIRPSITATVELYRVDWTSGGVYVGEGQITWKSCPANTWTQIEGAWNTGGTVGKISIRPIWTADNAGDVAYFDDFSLKMALGFGSLQTGAVNVSVSAGLTIPANLQGGVVLALDSDTSPANFIIAYYNRYLGKVVVDQYIADVLTNLAATTTAYVADAPLKAVKANGVVTVTYGGALVGSPVAVTESAYVLCGLFATDVSVTFANLVIK